MILVACSVYYLLHNLDFDCGQASEMDMYQV